MSHIWCSTIWLYTRRTIVRRELGRTRANSGELEQTRANSRELRANSPAVRRHPHSGELRRTFAGVRRTFAGVRRSSLGFARVRAYSAANWRTVRQKIRSPEEISTSVCRERGPPRTWFAANDNFGELVRQKLLENADCSSREFAGVRSSSPEFAANDSSPGIKPDCRTPDMRHVNLLGIKGTLSSRELFAANYSSPRSDVRWGRTYVRGPPQAKLKELSGKWSNSSSRRGAA